MQSLTELYQLLSCDIVVFEYFEQLSPKLLTHYKLDLLMMSDHNDEKVLARDLTLLLFRFDSVTQLAHVTTDGFIYEMLIKHESYEVWKALGQRNHQPIPHAVPQTEQTQPKAPRSSLSLQQPVQEESLVALESQKSSPPRIKIKSLETIELDKEAISAQVKHEIKKKRQEQD